MARKPFQSYTFSPGAFALYTMHVLIAPAIHLLSWRAIFCGAVTVSVCSKFITSFVRNARMILFMTTAPHQNDSQQTSSCLESVFENFCFRRRSFFFHRFSVEHRQNRSAKLAFENENGEAWTRPFKWVTKCFLFLFVCLFSHIYSFVLFYCHLRQWTWYKRKQKRNNPNQI